MGHFSELTSAHIVQTQDAQSSPVVGLVTMALVVVEVVINGRGGAKVRSDQGGVVQIQNVPDVGARVHTAFIPFIIDQKVA